MNITMVLYNSNANAAALQRVLSSRESTETLFELAPLCCHYLFNANRLMRHTNDSPFSNCNWQFAFYKARNHFSHDFFLMILIAFENGLELKSYVDINFP